MLKNDVPLLIPVASEMMIFGLQRQKCYMIPSGENIKPWILLSMVLYL